MNLRLFNVRFLNITLPAVRLSTVRPLDVRSYVMRSLAVQPLAVTPLSIINVIVILLLLYAAYVLDYLLFQFYDPFTKKRQTISFVVYKTSFGLTCLPLVKGSENTQI